VDLAIGYEHILECMKNSMKQCERFVLVDSGVLQLLDCDLIGSCCMPLVLSTEKAGHFPWLKVESSFKTPSSSSTSWAGGVKVFFDCCCCWVPIG
jgi:hypothetical protein